MRIEGIIHIIYITSIYIPILIVEKLEKKNILLKERFKYIRKFRVISLCLMGPMFIIGLGIGIKFYAIYLMACSIISAGMAIYVLYVHQKSKIVIA